MRSKTAWIGSCVLVLASVVLQLNAQRGGAAAPAIPGARGAQGGRGGTQGAPTQGFPAQQRPPGDATLISRGNTLYGIHCRACHGPDLRGGDVAYIRPMPHPACRAHCQGSKHEHSEFQNQHPQQSSSPVLLFESQKTVSVSSK